MDEKMKAECAERVRWMTRDEAEEMRKEVIIFRIQLLLFSRRMKRAAEALGFEI